jgi:uncharacterized membrane protein YeaQ/YmgE (transglycosylase-associated protein family)
MGVLAWIVLGLVAGAIAKLLMPGDQRGGCLMTLLLGVAGALLGGFIGRAMGFGGVDEFSLSSLGWAILGAFLLLLIFGLIFRKRR